MTLPLASCMLFAVSNIRQLVHVRRRVFVDVWRNRHTRWLQVPVPKGVRFRIPPHPLWDNNCVRFGSTVNRYPRSPLNPGSLIAYLPGLNMKVLV